MQQLKILRDAENDKFTFINPTTRNKSNYDSLESLVDKEFKQFFIRNKYDERARRQIVNHIVRHFVQGNLCTLTFPGDLSTGKRDNNIKIPSSYSMYRD